MDRIYKEHARDPDQLRYFQLGLYIHLLVPAGPGWGSGHLKEGWDVVCSY